MCDLHTQMNAMRAGAEEPERCGRGADGRVCDVEGVRRGDVEDELVFCGCGEAKGGKGRQRGQQGCVWRGCGLRALKWAILRVSKCAISRERRAARARARPRSNGRGQGYTVAASRRPRGAYSRSYGQRTARGGSAGICGTRGCAHRRTGADDAWGVWAACAEMLGWAAVVCGVHGRSGG